MLRAMGLMLPTWLPAAAQAEDMSSDDLIWLGLLVISIAVLIGGINGLRDMRRKPMHRPRRKPPTSSR